MIELRGKYTNAKIWIDDVEPACLAKIIKFINNICFDEFVAIMPDTHDGKGSVIGFTMPLSKSIIPNIIGVDIGCGILAIKLSVKVKDFSELNQRIREVIPMGSDVHGEANSIPNHVYKKAYKTLTTFVQNYNAKFG